MEIQTQISARIRPAREFVNQQRWIVDHLEARRRFSLPLAAVMLLIVCVEPIEEQVAIKKVGDLMSLPVELLEQILDNLRHKELLIITTDYNFQKNREYMASFARNGWQGAWDYLLLTYNYPFVDYAGNGRSIDSKRMEEYRKIEPDNSRFKKYPSPLKRLQLPTIGVNLVPGNVRNAYRHLTQNEWGILELRKLCAVAFGKVGVIRHNHSDDQTSEPLYLRTSPSMGARHPVEAYALVQDVEGLDKGWYHVCVGDHKMDYISCEQIDFKSLSAWIPALAKESKKPPRAILLLTAVFERSMYRYREPHIFRSIHFDVGHLCASVELIARSHGMMVEIFPITQIPGAERLGIEMLTEGGMAAVALW